MAAATQAIKTQIRNQQLALSRKLTVATGQTIYEKTLVSIDGSGNAIPAATNARIAGLALSTKTAGETVEVFFGLMEAKLALSGAAITDVGTLAYAADNQTAQTSSNTAILGPIVDVETNYAWIALTTGIM